MSAAADWLRGALLHDMRRAEPRLTRRNAVECLDCGVLTHPGAQACPACASRSLVLAFPTSRSEGAA